MRCSSCGAKNPEGLKFCNECAAPFKRQCAKCGFENAATAKFCGECAAPLNESAGRVVSANAPALSVRISTQADSEIVAGGERKTVTALFADIKGSTELIRDLDPEEAGAIIDPALNLMIESVHRYDGYVVQSTGDGIFALFGAPVAHEDHPQRALHAAITTRDELLRRDEELRIRGRAGVEVRIGVNTGEVVMRMVQTGGHSEYAPVGHAINVAARMQTVAPAGGIVVSENTRHLVEGYFELHELGPAEVKGVSEPINVYEVMGVGALRGHFDVAARRGLTKFVGRENELQQIERALELAMSGHGQVVAVVAEAGTGKSRLFYEFKATIPTGCKLLEAYSVSYGKASAWLPVLELLRNYFGLEDTDDSAARREKVRGTLDELDAALADTLPFLFALLAIQDSPDPLAQMDPQIKRWRTLESVKRIILRESLNQPTIVVFEDVHWIDNETQALLDLLAERIASSRVLFLVNYRPEYRHEWTNKSYYSQLRLDSLGPDSASKMLSALLGNGVELAPVKHLIVEKTIGNPFFIEEMVQTLFDEGALVRNGVVKVTRSVSQLRLPSTVQGILAARMDRLPAEQKELLQTLAVLGRVSPLRLIRKVVSTEDVRLEAMLAKLQAGEFIYEQPALTDVEYVFKHALTQEVAYNSVLIGRRNQLHERIAQSIGIIFASNLVDHYSELAHHYRLSGNADKAINYLRLAGQQAIERSANTQATIYLKSALDLLLERPDTPERAAEELTLQVALAPGLQAIKGWAAPEVEHACSKIFQLCQQLGESPQIYSALFGLQAFYVHRAELRKALELAKQGLTLAENLQDTGLILQARHMLAYNLAYLGDLTAAREQAQLGIALYHPKYHSLAFSISGDDPGVCCFCFQGLAVWALGYPGQALKSVRDAISLAEKVSHPLSLALALTFTAMVHQLRREIESVQERADALITLCADQGFSFFLALGKIMHGWALTQKGEAAGIMEMHEGLAAYRATGANSFRPYHFSLMAEGNTALGHPEEALEAIMEGLEWITHADERFYEPELYRLKGALLLQSEGMSHEYPQTGTEAEMFFHRAIEAARQQNAKSHELRAAIGLGRLLATRGSRDEARAMLAGIYNWFSEGFDTADLKEAKALLDELNG